MVMKEYLNWCHAFHSVSSDEIVLKGSIGFTIILDFDMQSHIKKKYLNTLGRYGMIKTDDYSSTIELFINQAAKLNKFKKDALEGRLDDGVICVDHISYPPIQLTYELR